MVEKLSPVTFCQPNFSKIKFNKKAIFRYF